jgi:hypothetical protein
VSAPGKMVDILRDFLRIAARYIIAGALFHSGMRMVLNLAGIHAGPVEWVTPLGEFSGAQFAGIWLGVSPIFQTLGGLVEIAAGLLLLSPRTTTLGAMIAAGCFTNSLMLHLCFRPEPWVGDAILLLVATYLVLLDWRMLMDLFLLNRPTTPISVKPTWETPQTRKISYVLKGVFVAYFVFVTSLGMLRAAQGDKAHSEWSGVYSVASFSPANADLQHWWRVAAIDRYAERLTVRTLDGAGMTFQIQPNLPQDAPGSQISHRERVAAMAAPEGRLTLIAPDGTTSVWSYSRSDAGRLVLQGALDGVAMTADLRLTPSDSLPFLGGKSYPEPSDTAH